MDDGPQGDPGHGRRARRPAQERPGLEPNDAIALGLGHGQPDRRWPTPTPPSPTAACTTTGSRSRRSPAPPTARCSTARRARPTGCSPSDIAADVSYALQQVVQNGTGQNALALGRPAAGKTGTATNEDGDVSSSWFVGYTPQVATAVMYVRGKGNEALNGFLPSYFGGDYPTYTWRAVMERGARGHRRRGLPRAGVRRRRGARRRATRRTRRPPPTSPSRRRRPTSPTRQTADPRRRRRRSRSRPPDPGSRVPAVAAAPAARPGASAARLRPDGPQPAPRDRRADPRGPGRPLGLSEVVGGPVGPARAGRTAWWVPVRVLLAAVRGGLRARRWCSTSPA